MIAGHFGFAALVKAREPEVPLWGLMLATVWLDIIFVPLYLVGIESIELVPGTLGSYGAGYIHADYTHSLCGALLLATLFGCVAALPWGRRCGIVLGMVAFSHWLLDLVVHRRDMPLLPGNLGHLPKLGFGVWQWPLVAIAAEFALVALGSYCYWRAARHAVRTSGGIGRIWATIDPVALFVSGCAVLLLDAIG